jgi:hypothetical protein
MHWTCNNKPVDGQTSSHSIRKCLLSILVEGWRQEINGWRAEAGVHRAIRVARLKEKGSSLKVEGLRKTG